VAPASGHVQLVSPQLAQVLREPCAETHLHLGAAVSFPDIWTGLVYSLAVAVPSEISKQPNTVHPPLGDGAKWVGALYGAMVARLLFAAFLWHRDQGHAVTFGEFASRTGVLHRDICSLMRWSGGPDEAYADVGQVLSCLVCPPSTPLPLHLFQRVYVSLLAGRSPPSTIQTMDALRCADPLKAWTRAADPELHLATRLLHYLRDEGRSDEDLTLVFWQYQRIRSLTYRHLVQAPGVPGLDWFTRIYGRITSLAKAIDATSVTCALELESQDLNLGAIELRMGPKAKEDQVIARLRSVAKQSSGFSPPPGNRRAEVGVLFHFIKARSNKVKGRASLSHADPRAVVFPMRHGRWFETQRSSAQAIASALNRCPELLVVLRGIDAASVEQAQPTWVLLPLFERVRQAAQQASLKLGHSHPDLRTPTLRATVHAGEDFTRLVEGIRRMHESVEFDLLRMGDRIGHGVALGIDPARWMKSHPSCAQTAEDRLDDLLWELTRYSNQSLDCSASRVAFVQGEVARLSRHMYGDSPPTTEQLLALRGLLHQPSALERVGYPFPSSHDPTDELGKLLARYLSDGSVYARGQQIVTVSGSEHEVAMLQAAQRFLRRELSRLEITVESNPSSNLLIGNFASLDEIPTFRLDSPMTTTKEEPGDESVLLSINSDDPVSFASCLADEYAHIYYSLLRQQIPARDALKWIDHVRAVGWRSRFTVPASAEPSVLNGLALGT
jgi:hypothetical protein